MKIISLFLLVLLYAQTMCAQQMDLSAINNKRYQINRNGMKLLGSWAAGNIVYGAIAASQKQGSDKYFYQMNALWNSFTLGLAAIGYCSKKDGALSLQQSLQKQASVEKLFLLNAGLDVAYIAGGLYLKERGKQQGKNMYKNKGYGQSIILQGSALLLFDAIMYLKHTRNGAGLYPLVNKVSMGVTEGGVGLVVGL